MDFWGIRHLKGLDSASLPENIIYSKGVNRYRTKDKKQITNVSLTHGFFKE